MFTTCCIIIDIIILIIIAITLSSNTTSVGFLWGSRMISSDVQFRMTSDHKSVENDMMQKRYLQITKCKLKVNLTFPLLFFWTFLSLHCNADLDVLFPDNIDKMGSNCCFVKNSIYIFHYFIYFLFNYMYVYITVSYWIASVKITKD